jgi:hypothetical protein
MQLLAGRRLKFETMAANLKASPQQYNSNTRFSTMRAIDLRSSVIALVQYKSKGLDTLILSNKASSENRKTRLVLHSNIA